MNIYTISNDTVKTIIYNGKLVHKVIYNGNIVDYSLPPNRYLVGNFKMNLTDAEVRDYFSMFDPVVSGLGIIMFPGLASLKTAIATRKNNRIKIGAQDVSAKLRGAYTGQVSAQQLAALGVDYVLIGHSEKMEYLKEKDQIANEKLSASLSSGLKAVVCINDFMADSNFDDELTEQLDAKLNGIFVEQLSDIIFVYEPSFAIGTGLACTVEYAQERCACIRKFIGRRFDESAKEKLKILFGGSVRPNNARELTAQHDIDGLFCGGISLRANDMMQLASLMVE